MEAIEDTREDAFGNGESYTRYEKAGTYMKTYTNELFFGIGYFTDWSQVAPEAQQSVSDVDLKKGVKAYFVESSFYTGEQRKIHVFPLAYPGSDQTFEEQLYESAEALSSENIRRTIFHIVTEKGERSEDPSSTGLVESIPANENENEKEINRHFQKGYELTGLGRHEEAIQMYDQVIKTWEARRSNTNV